jgi:predicted secreted hydrolase
MKPKLSVKQKKRVKIIRLKAMTSFFIITLIIPCISVQAYKQKYHDQPEGYWKNYPYQPPGGQISFPTDEGSHDASEFPIEWWYANFHFTGQTTGKEYGSFVAFYKIDSPVAEKKEVRIFSISDIAYEKTFTNVQIGILTTSSDYLDLSFEYITSDNKADEQTITNLDSESMQFSNQDIMNTQESALKTTNQTILNSAPYDDFLQKTNQTNQDIVYQDSTDGYIQSDHWYTKYNDKGLVPFQYTLDISGNSQQDEQPIGIFVNMDCLKKPLMVGGNGLINYENDDFSYYYCLTKVIVTGTIIIHGFIEEISGYAWIDHQWGNFVNQNPPTFGLPMTYEWFSLQLDNNRELLVGDMWDRETGGKIDKSLTGGLNLIDCDGNSELLHDYLITPLRFWNDTTSTHFYSCQWRITEVSMSIDIVVTPVYLDQMIRFKENSPILQQILEALFPSACFWEGVCSISGTINGNIVNGKSYVELTHYCTTESK